MCGVCVYLFVVMRHIDWCHCLASQCQCLSSSYLSLTEADWNSAVFPNDSEAMQTSVGAVAEFTRCQETENSPKYI